MSYPAKMRPDGLCDPPAVELPARQLLGTVCLRAGLPCPLFPTAAAGAAALARITGDPSATIRLTSDADRIPHYTALAAADYAALDRAGVRQRKLDLDVLQRLGLAPGDARRARYLYELLFARIPTPAGLCAGDTPGWEGCPLAAGGAYERLRATGWTAMVPARQARDKAAARRASAARLRADSVLRVRPHHLMCMSCWYGSGDPPGPRPEDTLDVLCERILAEPDVRIQLVEGNCEACHCCDGFHAPSTRCVHAGGLLRDYKKDLDVFQRLGLMPGAVLPARELLSRLYASIHSTQEICGYGTGVQTSHEWSICGGPDGNPGYARARQLLGDRLGAGD